MLTVLDGTSAKWQSQSHDSMCWPCGARLSGCHALRSSRSLWADNDTQFATEQEEKHWGGKRVLTYSTSSHSFTKGTWDGSLRFCSHDNAPAEYWHQQRFFFSGPISISLTSLARFSWVSLLSYSWSWWGINNQLHVKKMEEIVLHVFTLLQMRSTDHQFQPASSSPLIWASFIRDGGKEVECKCWYS